ncbi:hypothetical protein JCM11641_002939 [Rhodosporidiobolus odoratus]
MATVYHRTASSHAPRSLSDSLTTAPLASLHDNDDDQPMDDDVRTAISALGLMRDGSLGGSPSNPTHPLPLAHYPHSPSQSTSTLDPTTQRRHSRTASCSYRSDPSRSTSTASTATPSEAWTSAAGTSETGYSTPVGTASVSGQVEDAEMRDKGMSMGMGGHEMGEAEHAQQDPRFMARVSQLPYVSGGIEWYERSKASSRVVKLGAGLVESSFSAASRPISGPLGSLDDFACRQLDRIGAGGASPGRKSPTSHGQHAQLEESSRGRTAERASMPAHDDPSTRRPSLERRDTSTTGSGGAGQVATVGQRSRWQTVLVEAGGLGAAVSEESLKSLRYCLQWLLYATAHLDHQISTIRDFILSLRAHTRQSTSSSNALVAASASANLTQIKHDVVETIRKVVEVVSKYAGAALPEQAKRYVRQSILGLPVKWASAIENRTTPGAGSSQVGGSRRRRRERSGSGMSMAASESDVGTPMPERMHESYFPGSSSVAPGASGSADGKGGLGDHEDGEEQLSPTEDAADRVLTFAVESLEMLRTVANIFGDSVEKAEAWIERLRIVGVDRQRQRQAAAAAAKHASGSSTPYALPPSGLGSPTQTPASAAFDDPAASTSSSSLAAATATGVKRRRPSASVSQNAVVSAGGANDNGGGQSTDGEGDGSGRRKRGTWREGSGQ